MKCVLATVILATLHISAAHAGSAECKRQPTEKSPKSDCKKKVPKGKASNSGPGVSATDREVLDRGHTRTLLENLGNRLNR